MSTPRIAWRWAVALTVIVALAGTTIAMPLELFAGISATMAAFGAMMGLAFKPDLPTVRHPVLGGVLLSLVPGLYPGLAVMIGLAAPAVVALLVLTFPWVATRIVRWMRGRLLPSEAEAAASASPEEALRRQWEESTRLLNGALTPRERLQVVIVRAQILDDVVQHSDGCVPDYVRATTPGSEGRGRSGAGA